METLEGRPRLGVARNLDTILDTALVLEEQPLPRAVLWLSPELLDGSTHKKEVLNLSLEVQD